MEILLFKFAFIGMIGLVLKALLDKIRESELNLLLQKISIEEFMRLRQNIAGISLFTFIAAMLILML